MAKFTQKLMVTLASAGLVLSPVAAQANTRAGDSSTVYTASQVAPGLGRSAEGEGFGGDKGDLIAALLVGLWATGIIVILLDLDDDDNQSPGAS